jgi:4-carboxymuconolactone decarboxylase
VALPALLYGFFSVSGIARVLGGKILPEMTYRLAVEQFGQKGASGLIYLVGHYCFVSVTLNGYDVPVPSD